MLSRVESFSFFLSFLSLNVYVCEYIFCIAFLLCSNNIIAPSHRGSVSSSDVSVSLGSQEGQTFWQPSDSSLYTRSYNKVLRLRAHIFIPYGHYPVTRPHCCNQSIAISSRRAARHCRLLFWFTTVVSFDSRSPVSKPSIERNNSKKQVSQQQHNNSSSNCLVCTGGLLFVFLWKIGKLLCGHTAHARASSWYSAHTGVISTCVERESQREEGETKTNWGEIFGNSCHVAVDTKAPSPFILFWQPNLPDWGLRDKRTANGKTINTHLPQHFLYRQ